MDVEEEIEMLEAENRVLRGQREHADQMTMEAREEVIYWKSMYSIMKRIIAEQKPDPAYEWLDAITRTKAVGG